MNCFCVKHFKIRFEHYDTSGTDSKQQSPDYTLAWHKYSCVFFGIPKILVYVRQFVFVACFGLVVAYVGQYVACHRICAIRLFCRIHDSNTCVDVARGTEYVTSL